MGKKFKTLLVGGVIGATLGVLYAPRAGKKTRAMLADKTEALWGEEAQANGTILGEVAKTTTHAVEAGKSIAAEVGQGTIGGIAKDVNKKRKNFNKGAAVKITEFSQANVRPVFSEKNDELRNKIEAARAKIAKQVANNIQGHVATGPKNTPVPPKKATAKPAAKPKPKPASRPATKATSTSGAKHASKPAAKKTAAKKPVAKKAATTKKTAAKNTAAKNTAKKKQATQTTTKKKSTK